MAAHNDRIAQGFADGVFLCVGSLHLATGGAILAGGESRAGRDARIVTDPLAVETPA